MFLLQFDGLAKKIDAEQRRLAAMPGETDDLLRRRLYVLNNITFEGFVIEAEIRSFGIKILFLEVVTVMTIEIAYRSDCLNHDLKFTRCGFQEKSPPKWGRLDPGVPIRLYSKKLWMSPLGEPIGNEDIKLPSILGIPSGGEDQLLSVAREHREAVETCSIGNSFQPRAVGVDQEQ